MLILGITKTVIEIILAHPLAVFFWITGGALLK